MMKKPDVAKLLRKKLWNIHMQGKNATNSQRVPPQEKV